jgi:hypothetical protein
MPDRWSYPQWPGMLCLAADDSGALCANTSAQRAIKLNPFT